MNARVDSFAAALAATAAGERPRRAALLLHTVAPADRQWLLERLPAAERAELEALVAELKAIGIPPAPELLDDLAPLPARTAASGARGLASADADAVLSTVAGEPAELIARLLVQADWPWRAEVLARIPAPKRQLVQDALTDRAAEATPLGALDRRLVDLVEAKLAAAATPPMPMRAAVVGFPMPAPGGLRRLIAGRVGNGRSTRP